MKKSLNENEALNINGKADDFQAAFAQDKDLVPKQKQIMSYGYFNLGFQFDTTRNELKKAAESHTFGKVFGWTLANHDSKTYVDQLMGDADVDGLIYGFKATHYYDHVDTRGAFNDIKNWVEKHSDTHRLAAKDDLLW